MMIKFAIHYPAFCEIFFTSHGSLVASEYVDIRDLLIRMHSEDRQTRDRARKILLNFIYETGKRSKR